MEMEMHLYWDQNQKQEKFTNKDLAWNRKGGGGLGVNQVTSGIQGAWTTHPNKWDDTYLKLLLDYEWELKKSQPALTNGNQ